MSRMWVFTKSQRGLVPYLLRMCFPKCQQPLIVGGWRSEERWSGRFDHGEEEGMKRRVRYVPCRERREGGWGVEKSVKETEKVLMRLLGMRWGVKGGAGGREGRMCSYVADIPASLWQANEAQGCCMEPRDRSAGADPANRCWTYRLRDLRGNHRESSVLWWRWAHVKNQI